MKMMARLHVGYDSISQKRAFRDICHVISESILVVVNKSPSCVNPYCFLER